MQSFSSGLKQDLVTALDVPQECITLLCYHRGSVVAEVALAEAGATGFSRGIDSVDVLAEELMRQCRDEGSKLRSMPYGRYARHMTTHGPVPSSLCESIVKSQDVALDLSTKWSMIRSTRAVIAIRRQWRLVSAWRQLAGSVCAVKRRMARLVSMMRVRQLSAILHSWHAQIVRKIHAHYHISSLISKKNLVSSRRVFICLNENRLLNRKNYLVGIRCSSYRAYRIKTKCWQTWLQVQDMFRLTLYNAAIHEYLSAQDRDVCNVSFHMDIILQSARLKEAQISVLRRDSERLQNIVTEQQDQLSIISSLVEKEKIFKQRIKESEQTLELAEDITSRSTVILEELMMRYDIVLFRLSDMQLSVEWNHANQLAQTLAMQLQSEHANFHLLQCVLDRELADKKAEQNQLEAVIRESIHQAEDLDRTLYQTLLISNQNKLKNESLKEITEHTACCWPFSEL
mmetsp:Transcript_34683/g.72745  ORF Transcript_34683/g.72745 Transcript_34683/m.72745 type:complete len:457 (-) Transcript_34683:411-1781(-)